MPGKVEALIIFCPSTTLSVTTDKRQIVYLPTNIKELKPSIPKGTRDFSPQEMVKRNYIFDTIRLVYQRYGYLPIETPSMENTETLMGKYGEEGDRLIFRILNSGPVLEQIRNLKFEIRNSDLFDKALRYDLTVPFARYVVMHRNEITFPFKRYQIQPVWRADRPQKGRYREFYQCDADVIGSNSLINEVEIVQMIDEVFTELKVPVIIKINNRKILNGLFELCEIPFDKINVVLAAIDEFDKIGIEASLNKLCEKGINEIQRIKLDKTLRRLMNIDLQEELIDVLGGMFQKHLSKDGIQGIAEMKFILDTLKKLFEKRLVLKQGLLSKYPMTKSFPYYLKENSPVTVHFDISLARGLNYYTGSIFEVKVDSELSKSEFTTSITGGGRYDDLTGIFGLPNLSGVGISFGADRIYDVLNELNLYPESVTAGTRLLFINKGGKSESISLSLLKKVRKKNIAAEIYPDNVKWEKQAKYVDAKKIPFTATVDENTFEVDGKITLKYSLEGKWKTENVSLDELINKIG